jgi:acylphosphatase
MSGETRRVEVVYEGDVQGVGFRYAARGIALELGLAGGVENQFDGTVRMVAEGPEEALRQLLARIRVSRVGPNVENERVRWSEARGEAGFYYR